MTNRRRPRTETAVEHGDSGRLSAVSFQQSAVSFAGQESALPVSGQLSAGGFRRSAQLASLFSFRMKAVSIRLTSHVLSLNRGCVDWSNILRSRASSKWYSSSLAEPIA